MRTLPGRAVKTPMRRRVPAVAAAVILLTIACRDTGPPRVSLVEPIPSDDTAAAATLPLRVAVAAMVSPSATIDAYTPLLDYVAARLDRQVRLVQRPTYAEVNELVRVGDVDLAFVCTGAFVEGEQQGTMELLAAPIVAGARAYDALIIVPAGSPAATFDDLRGKTFAFTDPLSNTGYLAVQWLLRSRGLDADGFFRSRFFTYSHDNSIEAVAGGLADGASVDSLVYGFAMAREPALAAKTRVLLRLGPYGMPPVVVRSNLAPDLKADLRRTLLDMAGDTTARTALGALGIDGFFVPDRSAYDSVRTMAAAVRRWR